MNNRKYNIYALVLILISVFFIHTQAFAEPATQRFVRGQGTGKDKNEAKNAAKRSAWNNYKAEITGAKLDNVIANEKLLLENLDDLMIDINVISEECKSGEGCVVRLKATVNENQIESKLRSIAKSTGSSKSSTGYVAMAIFADIYKSFDARVTKKNEATVSTTGKASSQDSSSSTDNSSKESMSDTDSVTQSSKSVSSGTTENKTAQITYRPYASLTDLQSVISSTLGDNNIKITDWAQLVDMCDVPPMEELSKKFVESEQGVIPSKILGSIYKKLKTGECEFSKFVIASISMDGFRKDPNSGKWIASGNVNVRALDITGKFSVELGAANKALSGMGNKQEDAARDALTNSASFAVDAIVNKVNLR